MYRSNTYDEDFSKDMEHPEARHIYLLTLIHDEDEPMSIEEALRFTIRRMGTVNFADLAGEKKQNVAKFLSGERKLKRETFDKYLLPFGLQTTLDVKPLDADKVA
jgi:DNA-binding phage protein